MIFFLKFKTIQISSASNTTCIHPKTHIPQHGSKYKIHIHDPLTSSTTVALVALVANVKMLKCFKHLFLPPAIGLVTLVQKQKAVVVVHVNGSWSIVRLDRWSFGHWSVGQLVAGMCPLIVAIKSVSMKVHGFLSTFISREAQQSQQRMLSMHNSPGGKSVKQLKMYSILLQAIKCWSTSIGHGNGQVEAMCCSLYTNRWMLVGG